MPHRTTILPLLEVYGGNLGSCLFDLFVYVFIQTHTRKFLFGISCFCFSFFFFKCFEGFDIFREKIYVL